MTPTKRTEITPLDEPLRLTVGNLKGGTGRSTSSVELALELHARTGQPVLLIDADEKNGTTHEWYEDAIDEGYEWPEGVTVVYWPVKNLARQIRDYKWKGHIIVDTPNDAAVLRQALMETDHFLIPIGTTKNDVKRLQPTLEAAAEVALNKEIELSILLCRVKARTRVLGYVRDALTEQGYRVLNTEVPMLVEYMEAHGTVPTTTGHYSSALTEILQGGTK